MQILIELNDPPTVEIYNRALQSSKFSSENAQATAAAQEHQRKLTTEQGRVAAILKARFKAVELYRVQRVKNAIAVQVTANKLEEIRKLPGVKAVSVLELDHTTAPSQQADSKPKSAAREEGRAGLAPASKSAAREQESIASAPEPEPTLPDQTSQVSPPNVEQELPVTVTAQAQRSEPMQFLVELQEPSAARVYGETLKKSNLPARQARLAAIAAARSSLVTIRSSQQRIGTTLRGSRFNAREIYRTQRAFNGIAIRVSPDRLEEIRRMPGVKEVHPLELEFLNTSTSVPFLGTPNVWGNTLGLPSGYTGAGVKIGIIDGHTLSTRQLWREWASG